MLAGALVACRSAGSTDEAKIALTRANLEAISAGLQMYKLDNGAYPSTEVGVGALVDAYIPKVPQDGWGRAIEYRSDGKASFTLLSFGADGAPGGEGSSADLRVTAPER